MRVESRIVVVDPSGPADSALDEAAATLGAGGLVAFPTETFYGLGAAALNPNAVRRVFDAKGRPDDKPLLLLVDSIAMAESIVTAVPPSARELMARHWPGPLTLVLRARASVPTAVTAGTGTVGVRVSPHPVALGLVRRLGEPITAPSANRAGLPPPTTAAEVVEGLGTAIDRVLDGGTTRGGLASTVVDVTVDPPRIVREGAVRIS